MQPEVMELFRELADSTPQERETYYTTQNVPENVRDELESLFQFDQASKSFGQDIAGVAQEMISEAPPPNMTGRWGAYRLVQPLGRGGMGEVYLAERADGELDHRVAIKVSRTGADLPAFRERFLAERSILASLNHPGIARLYDAGRTATGQPYLVMEYIDGVTIDEYCAKLDHRAIIRLFLQVCEAVSYAHRNLIIHRDLKPSNILVDSSGCPKLLDFGIARILKDNDPSQTQIRILTPEYASPEQVRGEAHSTATDIYSLGAVLRKLLQRPLAHDVDSILKKALRAEPEERYGTVDAFAEDLKAYLDNRPVGARDGNAWYHTRKFLRRYWVPATAGAVALMSLAIGLFIANRERLIAERQFRETRQLANKVFDIDKAIRNTPGNTEARKLIVATSLEYLERVSAQAHGDRDLALDIGSAYLQLAHVQGVPVNPNLGQFAQADDSLKKAENFIGSVLRSAPTDRRALLLASTIAHDRMVLAGVQNKREESLVHATKAADELDRFSTGRLDANDVKEVAFMYSNVAVTFDENHKFDDASRLARRSIEIARQREDTAPQQSLAYGILADALRQAGDLEAALSAVRESRRLQEQIPDTGKTWQRSNLILALWREGSILGEDGDINLDRSQEAAEVLRRALQMADDLGAKDLADTSHHQMEGEVARRLGDILRHSDPRAALAVYDQGIAAVLRAKNSNAGTKRTQAGLLASSSYPLRALEDNAEASHRIDTALQLLREIQDYPAERIEPGSETEIALQALADQSMALNEPAKASDTYQELLAKLKAWGPAPADSLRGATYLSAVYESFALALRQAGRAMDAAQREGDRRTLWESWDRKLPKNQYVGRQLARTKSVPPAHSDPAAPTPPGR